MPKPLPWSHTSLDEFVNCPKKFAEKRVYKTVKEPTSPEMEWGEIVHKHFENRQKLGTLLPADLAMHERHMLELETLPGVAQTEQKIALSRHLTACGFFDRDVWFRGVIDYRKINGCHALIEDYKTGKVHQKYKQLKLFALHTFHDLPDIHTIDVKYYWTQTQQALGERYTREMIPFLWSQFTPDLRQYVEAFRTDTWQPRPSGLCHGWCPVTSCQHWRPKRSK